MTLADGFLHWLAPTAGGQYDLAVSCTATAALKEAVNGVPAVGQALAAEGGARANVAVERLLSVAVHANGPTRKWQAVNCVMQLIKVEAVAGPTVVQGALALIAAAWETTTAAGAEAAADGRNGGRGGAGEGIPRPGEQVELLQCALLDLLCELAKLAPGAAQVVVPLGVGLIGALLPLSSLFSSIVMIHSSVHSSAVPSRSSVPSSA